MRSEFRHNKKVYLSYGSWFRAAEVCQEPSEKVYSKQGWRCIEISFYLSLNN